MPIYGQWCEGLCHPPICLFKVADMRGVDSVLRELMMPAHYPMNWPFMNAVDTSQRELWDYPTIVKQPVWLNKGGPVSLGRSPWSAAALQPNKCRRNILSTCFGIFLFSEEFCRDFVSDLCFLNVSVSRSMERVIHTPERLLHPCSTRPHNLWSHSNSAPTSVGTMFCAVGMAKKGKFCGR